MKPTILRIENFLGIGVAQFNLDRPGLTLVEGINHDSKTSISNGAGKSSVWEALLHTLFGITKREAKGDDLINKHIKGGMLTALEFEIAGVPYVIIRTRKRKPFNTGLRFFRNGRLKDFDLEKDVVPDGVEDLTAGVIKDTQERIDEVVGMSAQTFVKSCFFGQGDVKPMAGLTDGELKTIFTQALGITFFDEAASRLRGYATSIKSNYEEAERSKDFVDSEVVMLEERHTSLNRMLEGLAESKASQIEGFEKEAAAKELHSVELSETIGRLQKVVVEKNAQIKILSVEVDKFHVHNTKFQEAMTRHSGIMGALSTDYNRVKREITNLTDKIDHATKFIGTDCETCGREYSDQDIKDMKAASKSMVDKLSFDITNVAAKFNRAKTSNNELEGLKAPLAAKISELSATISSLTNEATKADTEIKAAESARALADYHIEAAQRNIRSLNENDEAASYKKELAEVKAQFDSAVKESKRLAKDNVAREKHLARADKLSDILGNGGIKSYIFDAITPELNRYANEYMSTLDEQIDIEVATVSKTKAGELREKFAVNVNNRAGGNSFKLNSGGEKQKVNLAIALAFNRVMRSMSTDVPLLVLDEPFEALDAGSSERVTELLGSLDAENVYLVTHSQEVKDMVSKRLIIEKRGGVAEIKEAI